MGSETDDESNDFKNLPLLAALFVATTDARSPPQASYLVKREESERARTHARLADQAVPSEDLSRPPGRGYAHNVVIRNEKPMVFAVAEPGACA